MDGTISLAEALQMLAERLTNNEISEETAFDAMAALVRENAMVPSDDDDQSELSSQFDEDQESIVSEVHDLVYERHDWAAACHRLADLHDLINPLINDRFFFSLTPARVELNADEPSIKMHREDDTTGSLPH